MVKFKIFRGSNFDCDTADIKANEWISENPNISIISMNYQQARYGDHSICVMYSVDED